MLHENSVVTIIALNLNYEHKIGHTAKSLLTVQQLNAYTDVNKIIKFCLCIINQPALLYLHQCRSFVLFISS